MEEKVLCNICNLDDTKLLFIKDGVKLVRCQRCGLVYVNPRLVNEVLSNQYQEAAYFDYYIAMEASDRQTFAARLNKIEKRVRPGRLLDIGCARGTFLQVAKSRGWETVGVDVSPVGISHCQSLGLTAYCGNLPDLQLPEASFDFVNMEDSIEHMPNPGAVVKEVYRLLKPDGWLLIRTPDVGSVLARTLGKNWIQVKPKEHVYYFTAATLKKLLQPLGFTVERSEALGRFFYLGLVAEKLKEHSLFFGKIGAALVEILQLEKKTVPLNLGDEIGVWAQKKV